MSKHTPGPWSVEGLRIAGGDGFTVAGVTRDDQSGSNARLIAAAPELLEALCMLVRCTVSVPGTHGLAIDNALAVIAKATGEQS